MQPWGKGCGEHGGSLDPKKAKGEESLQGKSFYGINTTI
jgi:hypothetical protein